MDKNKECKHDWKTSPNGSVQYCTKCGLYRASTTWEEK